MKKLGKAVHKYPKKRRKNIFLIEIILILAVFVFLVFLDTKKEGFEEENRSEDYVPVQEVQQGLSFFVYSLEEWEQFFETYEEQYLTREMVSGLLKQIGVSEVILFEENKVKNPVNRSNWYEIYKEILLYLDIEHKVIEKELVVLSIEEMEDNYQIYTNEGVFYTELPKNYFNTWENYNVYIMDGKCIGVVGKSTAEKTIFNTYIFGVEKDKISFLYQGNTYTKDANLGMQELTEGVADIVIKDGKIITISQKQDYIVGDLLSYDEDTIEIEGYGKIAHPEVLPVYQAYEDIKEVSLSDIVIGNMEAKYIIGVNEVCAIILTGPAEISAVRVLLLAEGGGKFRQSVYLTSDDKMLATYNKNTTIQPAGTIIDVSSYINNGDGTFILETEAEEGYLYLCNADGKKISNPYAGQMEVRKYEDGYCVVNEVAFETYLYSVVPSEMPSNYHPEALKAQAVCARSYAYIQVMRADLAAYGAHINDSSSYQVYNNVAKTSASINAVDETAGKILMYDGEVAEAYYFSTSMGYTDTVEVWNVNDVAPYGYLKQACLNQNMFSGDLSTEEGFKAYLETEVTGYDSNIKFYRWKIICEDYLLQQEEISILLEQRKKASNRHITYYKKEEIGEDIEVSDMQKFGKMCGIGVKKRSKSGSILELKVDYENGYVIVRNEYNIRKVLGISAKKIVYQNGNRAEWTSLIPSAFCLVERQNDGSYLLYGGGYGHGLGMSQNGANGLAKNGYNYEEILQFFYKDIELVNMQKGTE